MRKVLALVAAVGLLAAACSDGGDDPAATGSNPDTTVPTRSTRADGTTEIRFVSALRQVGNCDALLSHLRGEASERVGPYGLGGGMYAYATDLAGGSMMTAEADSGRAATAPASDGDSGAGSSGADHSTTNAQELGVDEPDIVKTDGTRIFTLTNGVLSIVDTSTQPPTRIATVDLATETSYPSDFLVSGDRLLVFGSGWESTESDEGTDEGGNARSSIWAPGLQLASITEISIADPAAPRVGATLRVDGWYLASRLVDGTARVVLRSEPTQLPFVYPQSAAAEDRAEKANREVVEQSTIEDWMPSYELRAEDGSIVDSGLLVDCERVEAPTEFAGFGTLSVLTFDMEAALGDGSAASILAAGDTAYASTTGLYVATTSYLDPLLIEQGDDAVEQWNEDFATSIHAFDITGSAPATYRSSGNVPGHLINQFAMSEHDGKLRVATTKGMPWAASDESESLITVLEEQGDRLAQIGQAGDMGRGERIYSVRYAGDIAYVVTFRQTDPFYTVDLSDPTAPTVVGELKIPGYSSYLHPIDDGLVIGVGQHATDDGRVQGTKVSLFDVSDPSEPAEIATWTAPHSHSNAEYDHHAFLYWPATKQLVLPLNEWNADGHYEDGFFGAIVLGIDRNGITEAGRLSHAPVTPSFEDYCGPSEPEPRPADDDSSSGAGASSSPGKPGCEPQPQPDPIQRSLVIGDDLWTMGQWALQQHALADLTAGATIAVD